MHFIAAIFLLMFSCVAQAHESWRLPQAVPVVLESAWQFVNYLDYRQTLEISRDCKSGGTRREHNPVLGECPQVSQVNTWFLLGAVVHGMFYYYMPERDRMIFQMSTVLVSSGVVVTNFTFGVKF